MRPSAPPKFSVAGIACAVEGVWIQSRSGTAAQWGPAEPRACDSRSPEDVLLTQSRQGGTLRICSSVASCGEPRTVPSSNLKCPQSKSCRFRGGAWPVATPVHVNRRHNVPDLWMTDHVHVDAFRAGLPPRRLTRKLRAIAYPQTDTVVGRFDSGP